MLQACQSQRRLVDLCWSSQGQRAREIVAHVERLHGWPNSGNMISNRLDIAKDRIEDGLLCCRTLTGIPVAQKIIAANDQMHDFGIRIGIQIVGDLRQSARANPPVVTICEARRPPTARPSTVNPSDPAALVSEAAIPVPHESPQMTISAAEPNGPNIQHEKTASAGANALLGRMFGSPIFPNCRKVRKAIIGQNTNRIPGLDENYLNDF